MTGIYAKVEYPNNGYDSDIEQVAKLDSTLYYPVYYIDIGSSSTKIYLNNINIRNSFNSVNFEFYELVEGKYVKYDIFEDPDFNPYLED